MNTGILFVCTGNICRSPTAEGVLRIKLAKAGLNTRIRLDSVGLIGYHVGDPPDPRSRKVAAEKGYPIDDLRARQIAESDFQNFPWMIAMDQGHARELQSMAPIGKNVQIHTLLSFWPESPTQDVPDPYYGTLDGFHHTFDLIDQGTDALLAFIKSKLDGRPPQKP